MASFDRLRCVQGDSSEADIKNVKHEKHKVENKLNSLRSELEAVPAPSEFDSRLFENASFETARKPLRCPACAPASPFISSKNPSEEGRFLILETAQVQKLVDGAKTDLAAHVKSGAKDDKKHQELEKLLHDHDDKRKKIEGLIAELEPELRRRETSLADARKQVEQLEDLRYSSILLAIRVGSAELYARWEIFGVCCSLLCNQATWICCPSKCTPSMRTKLLIYLSGRVNFDRGIDFWGWLRFWIWLDSCYAKRSTDWSGCRPDETSF